MARTAARFFSAVPAQAALPRRSPAGLRTVVSAAAPAAPEPPRAAEPPRPPVAASPRCLLPWAAPGANASGRTPLSRQASRPLGGPTPATRAMSTSPEPVATPAETPNLPPGSPQPSAPHTGDAADAGDVEPGCPPENNSVETPRKKAKKRKLRNLSDPEEDFDELLREDVDAALREWHAARGEEYQPAKKREVYPPFKRFEETEVEIVSQTVYGDGIGISSEAGGWAVIVPFVLPGERARAKVCKNFHGYSKADFISVSNPSDVRIQPRCQHFTVCAGCRLQHVPYQEQLKFKRAIVNRALAALLPDLDDQVAEFPVGSPLEYGYRTKLTPHFSPPRKAKPGDRFAIGFQMDGRPTIVDVEECPIATKACNEGMVYCHDQVRKKANTYKRGATLLIRESTDPDTGEKTFETDSNKMVMEEFAGLKFKFPAGSFFQNNNSILPLLTSYVASQLATHAPTTAPPRYFVDAYCGSGLFAVACHGPFEKVVGVEISQKSIAFAAGNAELNGAQDKCSFVTGSAENVFENITESGMGWSGHETAMVIDPPRKGCGEDFLEQLLRFAPSVCVYVSCDVFSQARDLMYLRKRWENSFGAVPKYRMVAARPFDLFPHTRHIENVVTLVRER